MNKLPNFFVEKVLFLVVLSLQSFVAIECFATDQDATNRQLTLEDIQQIVVSYDLQWRTGGLASQARLAWLV